MNLKFTVHNFIIFKYTLALTHLCLSLSDSLVLRQMVTAKPVLSVVYRRLVPASVGWALGVWTWRGTPPCARDGSSPSGILPSLPFATPPRAATALAGQPTGQPAVLAPASVAPWLAAAAWSVLSAALSATATRPS